MDLVGPGLPLLRHLLKGPAVPVGHNGVGAQRHLAGVGLLTELLPRHRPELARDLQLHAVFVARRARVGLGQLVVLAGARRRDLEGRAALRVRARRIHLEVVNAAIDAPAQGPVALLRAVDPRGLGALGHPGVEALPRITIEQDVELLPPVLAERHGIAVRPGPLGLHGRRLPPRERARDGVATHRYLLILELAAASGPEEGEHLLPHARLLQSLVRRRPLRRGEHGLAEEDCVDVGPSEALARDPSVHVVHGELDGLVHVVDLVLALHVRVDLVQVVVRRHGAVLVAHEDPQERGHTRVLDAVAHARLHGGDAQGGLVVLAP
mmetsp:Transcript_42717/g.92872  ORF Transcript_42717/g.92872 Transcript_42717/m.92872 type:complete len:323 (-) Transcript_42717:70-1038(-)